MTTGTNSLTGTMGHKCKSVFELNNINIFMKTNIYTWLILSKTLWTLCQQQGYNDLLYNCRCGF